MGGVLYQNQVPARHYQSQKEIIAEPGRIQGTNRITDYASLKWLFQLKNPEDQMATTAARI